MDSFSTNLYLRNRRADAAQGITSVHSGPLPACPCFWVLVGLLARLADAGCSLAPLFVFSWEGNQTNLTCHLAGTSGSFLHPLDSNNVQSFMCSPGSHSSFWERCLHCYNFPVLSFRQEHTKSLTSSVNDSSNPALSPLQWLQQMAFWVDSWTGITTCCTFSWHSLSTYSCHLGPLEGTSLGNQSLLEAAKTFATGARVGALQPGPCKVCVNSHWLLCALIGAHSFQKAWLWRFPWGRPIASPAKFFQRLFIFTSSIFYHIFRQNNFPSWVSEFRKSLCFPSLSLPLQTFSMWRPSFCPKPPPANPIDW